MSQGFGVGIKVPEVLLPAKGVDLGTWAVIACDQYTSQPDYWNRVADRVGQAPSTFHLILPEVWLEEPDQNVRVKNAHAAMNRYQNEGVLEAHEAFIYVERQITQGTQKGLIVALDLEDYDFSADARTLARTTEGTVLDRLPPRAAVRREASLELPHILVLYDDPDWTVLADILAHRDELDVAYDVELMENSGHLTGRFVTDPKLQESVTSALAALIEPKAYQARYGLSAEEPMLFAMGDGNHSLATAKKVWEELKPSVGMDHPARWALVELVNLHDESLVFEPIHRVMFNAGSLMDDLRAAFPAAVWTAHDSYQAMVDAVFALGDSQRFGVATKDGQWLVEIAEPELELAVATVQTWLDPYLAEHPEVGIDYIHGEDVTGELASHEGNVGIVVPPITKNAFFRSIAVDGALPRKTFSMGHAHDKRFYMECRRIVV